MPRKLFSVIVCLAMLFASLSCQILSGTAPSSSNPPAVPEKTSVQAEATTAPEPTATVDSAATAKAAEEVAKATEDAKSKATAEAASAKATDQAAQKLARTATAEGKATAQAQDMYTLLEKLKSDGTLTSTEGNYYSLEDFSESWAQINWYQWWNTGHKPSNFVIRTHTAWESASKTANWFAAGCGFVFRATDVDNHYMIFLALDGNVYMRGYVDAKYREFGKGYAGRIDHIKGEADIVLAVQGDHIVYYVNGNKVFDKRNEELTTGELGLTLNSGTNKDYGTRCDMTNIELWELAGQ
jgi:hypothetical protein